MSGRRGKEGRKGRGMGDQMAGWREGKSVTDRWADGRMNRQRVTVETQKAGGMV